MKYLADPATWPTASRLKCQALVAISMVVLGSAGLTPQAVQASTQEDGGYPAARSPEISMSIRDTGVSTRFLQSRMADWEPPRSINSPSDTSSFTTLGSWSWGPCLAVAARDGFVYFGNGSLFEVGVLDSNLQLSTIGVIDIGVPLIRSIVLKDSLAYVAAGALFVLSIADPANMRIVATLNLPDNPIRLALSSAELYIATRFGIFLVVDISTPTEPRLRGSALAAGEGPGGFASWGQYAYLCTGGFPELSVFDATDPDWPTRSSFGIGGMAAAEVEDTLLVFAGWDEHMSGGGLVVYSVAVPNNPTRLGHLRLDPGDGNLSLAVSDSIAFLATATGLLAISIGDPNSPRILGTMALQQRNTSPLSAATSDEYVHVASYTGLWTASFSIGSGFSDLGFRRTSESAVAVSQAGDLYVVGCKAAGAWILRWAEPGGLTALANLNPGGNTEDVMLDGSILYVLVDAIGDDDTSAGVWVYDITAPAQPLFLSHYRSLPSNARMSLLNRLAQNNQALLVTITPGVVDTILEIIDKTDPSNLSHASAVAGGSSPLDVDLQDSLAVVSTMSDMSILDLSSIEHPEILFSIGRYTEASAMNGPTMYSSHGDTTVVWDIGDPRHPVAVGTVNPPSNSFSDCMFYASGFVYLGSSFSFHTIDVRQPSNPVLMGTHQLGMPLFDGSASHDTLVLALGYSGVRMLRREQPNSVTLFGEPGSGLHPPIGIFPNPTNGRVNVWFYAPAVDVVSMGIFDIMGRQCMAESFSVVPGWGAYPIDLSALSSGTYFLRVIGRSHTRGRSFILLK